MINHVHLYVYTDQKVAKWKKKSIWYIYTLPYPSKERSIHAWLASWPHSLAQNFINETTENWKKTKKLLLLQTELGRENERLK